MDPHAILGLEPGATAEEVQRAYRQLAKRFHPDRQGEASGELMISINAAHDMLVEQLAEGFGGPGRRGARRPFPDADPAGASSAAPRAHSIDWLEPAVLRVVARELLAKLERGEQVEEVVLTSTGDSHEVQLLLTDRRMLWLRDDAIVGRVRSLRYRDVVQVIPRPPGRLRAHGELRLALVNGRRLRFFDLRPEVLRRLGTAVAAKVS